MASGHHLRALATPNRNTLWLLTHQRHVAAAARHIGSIESAQAPDLCALGAEAARTPLAVRQAAVIPTRRAGLAVQALLVARNAAYAGLWLGRLQSRHAACHVGTMPVAVISYRDQCIQGVARWSCAVRRVMSTRAALGRAARAGRVGGASLEERILCGHEGLLSELRDFRLLSSYEW